MSKNKLIKQVFELHNKIRTNPKSFIPYLESQLKNYDGAIYRRMDPDEEIEIETSEGKTAVLEAIEYLKKVSPLPEFILSKHLSMACQDHANDLGKNGLCDSVGSDGRNPDERIKRLFKTIDNIGENLDFNSHTAEDIIYSCLVDDGICDRSRRKNMFNKNYNAIGIGISEHKDFGNVIVLDYIGGIDLNKIESLVFEEGEYLLYFMIINLFLNFYPICCFFLIKLLFYIKSSKFKIIILK